MYEQSAEVYDALCRHHDYAAATLRLQVLLDRLAPEASDLLDVACGTGGYLEHLKERYRVEGLDLSAEMLRIAADRCPGVPLHQADFMDFRIDRRFDVICCLFGSIGYSTTLDGLRRALGCMAGHLRPGGVLIVEPWITPERFVDGKLQLDVVDDPELKVSRMYVSRREGRVSVYDSEYLIGTPDGVERFAEHEQLGLFTDAEYRAAFQEEGLEVVEPETSLFGYGLYAGLSRAEKT